MIENHTHIQGLQANSLLNEDQLKANKELLRLNILSLPLEFLRRFLYLVPTYPRQIQVEITNRCDLKCRMCPRETYSLPDEDFPRENFFKIVDELLPLAL